MPPSLYTIGQPADVEPSPPRRRKGRAFSAHLLASIEADAIWSGGQTDTHVHRPVAAWFAGSDDALRPFVANLREGRRAMHAGASKQRASDALEFLRSSGFQVAWQRYPEGSVARLWLPDLFALDPGPGEDGAPVAFVCAPSVAWATSLGLPSTQAQGVLSHLAALGQPLERDLPAHLPSLALAWAAQLDRRVRWPLIADPRFAAQLLVAFVGAQRAFFSSYGRSFYENTVAEVGLLSGVATYVNQSDAAALIARETERYFAHVDPPRAERAALLDKHAAHERATQLRLGL